MNYKVSHPTKVVECEINLPSSKSISNRLLIIQALCKEHFHIHNISDSEDTIYLKDALNSTSEIIDVGAAGTSFRFLTSYFSIKKGKEFLLTGSERIKQRPIKQLVESLRRLGANIDYFQKDNFPPLKILGKELDGGKIQINGSVSSQFISSLLLISPIFKKGLEIEISGELVSKPFVEMTLSLMNEFGVKNTWINNTIKVKPQKYIARDYMVESDWSAASFWFEVASLSENCYIKLNELSKDSIQGDKTVMRIFKDLGVDSMIEPNSIILTKNNKYSVPKTIDLLKNPDLYQPIKCTLSGLERTSEITGVFTLKHKETNRIKSVDTELINIKSTKIIETYKDHRMAMSFAPLCLIFGELQINNADVVNKSYPNFWEDLKRGGFKISS